MIPMQLPSFRKPPVVETILGIQFEPIPGFTNSHLGAFWASLGGRDKWPFSDDAQPLEQEFERFGEDRQWQPIGAFRLGLSHIPTYRMRLHNAERDRLVQVQNGRFIYNWLGTKGGEYARYERIRPEFEEYFEKFRQFLQLQGLPQIQVNQWEVTYTNHLPKGTVWSNISDWKDVFKFQTVPPAQINDCSLESFGGQWLYEIAPRQGRLRIQLQHAFNEERQEILLLTLTARGPVRECEGVAETFEAGLNLGHEVIVTSFDELASDQAKNYWEQTDVAG